MNDVTSVGKIVRTRLPGDPTYSTNTTTSVAAPTETPGASGIPIDGPEIVVEQPATVDLINGDSRDFGDVVTGMQATLAFTIRNIGTANLTGLETTIAGVDAASFSVTTAPTGPLAGPNGSTTFVVRFAPTTAGTKTATLHINSNDTDENPFDIVLNGEGMLPLAPEIVVEQPLNSVISDGDTCNYGGVTVGDELIFTFTIRNTGNVDLTGLNVTINGTDANSFNVTTYPSAPLAPNDSTILLVRFAPQSRAMKTATLHVQSNDSDESPFDIILNGQGLMPIMAVEQPANTVIAEGGTRDFGGVLLRGNVVRTFTLKNVGDSSLSGLDVIIDGPDAALFSVMKVPVGPVAGPNGSTTFEVQFAPESVGTKTAAVHVFSDGENSPLNFTVTGTGISPLMPEILVEHPLGTEIPDDWFAEFPNVVVGGSANLAFRIKNIGTTNLTGLVITIDGEDATMFSVVANPTAPVSGPNGSTTFTLRFRPTSPGFKVAYVHIASNDSDENPFDIFLYGNALGPQISVEQPNGSILQNGEARDFGSVVTGSSSNLIFKINNDGDANLTGLGITFTGPDAARFSVIANPTAPVIPGGTTTFTVRFTPNNSGIKAATMHIASNDGDDNPFDIVLNGTGALGPEIAVEQPVNTNIADGGAKDFGAIPVGGNTNVTFTVKNLGDSNLTGLGITINGTDAAAFSVTANPTAPVTGPNGSTTFTVRFAPTSTGAKTAALHIASNDANENPFDINLSGTGVSPTPPSLGASSISLLPDRTFIFTFSNPHEIPYKVIFSDTIQPIANWTVLGVVTNIGGGVYQFGDSTAPNSAKRYYQLRYP